MRPSPHGRPRPSWVSVDASRQSWTGWKTRQATLNAGTHPEEVRWVEGSETVSEHWSTIEDRNAYLRNASVKIYVRHHKVDDPDLAFEHDLMGVPKTKAPTMKLPGDDHVSMRCLNKDGITAKLYLGDLQDRIARNVKQSSPADARGFLLRREKARHL